MRTTLLISAIAACALSATVTYAQEPPAAGKPATAMGMEMEIPMQEPMQEPMTPMPATMEKMQQQMEQIGTTTDPKEHQKLMDAHMLTMQENMKAMRAMASPAAGAAMEPGQQMQKGMKPMRGKMAAPAAGAEMEPRQQMIEKRMDMMQMILEQMMLRDQATPPPMAPMSDM